MNHKYGAEISDMWAEDPRESPSHVRTAHTSSPCLSLHKGLVWLPKPHAEGTQAKAGVGVESGDNIPFILPLKATRHNPTFSVMYAPLERQRFLKPDNVFLKGFWNVWN